MFEDMDYCKYLYLNNLQFSRFGRPPRNFVYLIQSRVMNKSVVIGTVLLVLVMSSAAQQLQNTMWKGFWKPTQDSLIIDSKIDSAYVNTLTGFNLATSNYWEVQDTFYMVDIYGPVSCPMEDTGIYLFQITGDSLKFYVIEDSCTSRSSGLDSMGLLRVQTLTVPENIESLAAIYPNPVDIELNVTLIRNFSTLEYVVLDVAGNLISAQTLHGIDNFRIDMSTYEAGIYFVKIIEGENNQVMKVIKN